MLKTPRLFAKQAAIARGVHIATMADAVDAVNDIRRVLTSQSDQTLAQINARLVAVEAGSVLPDDPYPNSWMQPLTGNLIATGTLYAAQELIG